MSVIKVNTIQHANGTTALTIAANGQVTLANTPLQLTGGQIVFPGTQIASADGNTLDDYEEGTWTPVIQGVGGSIGSQAYSIQAGRYIKIGRFVLLTGYIQLTNKGSWSGDAEIRGFPFTVNNEAASYSAHTFYYGAVTLPANNFGLGAYVNIGNTTARVFSTNNTGATNSDFSIIGNSSQLGPFQFCYYASA